MRNENDIYFKIEKGATSIAPFKNALHKTLKNSLYKFLPVDQQLGLPD